jgi:hypothetical protein
VSYHARVSRVRYAFSARLPLSLSLSVRSVKVGAFSGYVFDRLLLTAGASADCRALVHSFVLELLAPASARDAWRQGARRGAGEELQQYWLGHVLSWTRLLCALKSNERAAHQQLLFQILEHYPQRVGHYLQNVPYTFEPRASSRWFANMALLKRLYARPTALPLLLTAAQALHLLAEYTFPASMTQAALRHVCQTRGNNGIKNSEYLAPFSGPQ